MRFWIRELAGWLLIALGLYIFYVCYAILVTQGPYLLEAGPLTFIGFVIFRGGIHLLKVAMAARICLHAQAQVLREQKSPEKLVQAGRQRDDALFDW